MRKLAIAIDGPAGAGKSSVAKVLAQKLGYLYIDTGAMYRAITWYALTHHLLKEPIRLIEALPKIGLTMEPTATSFRIYSNGQEITKEIRSQQVNENVSEVAAIKEVRSFLVAQQREMAKGGAIILDGRDIASVVLPDADVKIYLTASVEARAKRRWLEMQEKGDPISLEKVQENVAHRDDVDMHREESPLLCVAEATIVDSSDLSFDETVQALLKIVQETVNPS